ncbi:MAG: sugar phosphate isomerase/epimerase [Oscillospiraceae bacterium]|nr:sugar phosphate isomerase/epimerase [Oscillospiraceae bacterium]
MNLKLGINLGFAVNRYIEPEIWAKIVSRDLGLKSVQFAADLLNPFLPESYVKQLTGRIKNAVKEYGITIDSMFTSAYTRVNHLMHPDKEAREIWLDWFKKFLDMGQSFGAKTLGSHFGILTFDSFDNNYEFLVEEGVKNWQKLTFYAEDLGYESLIFEPMSVPREMAHTIPEAKQLMDRVNADCGVPMRLCLDVGHAPHPDYRDPYPWVEQLGKYSPIIHIQQTVLHRSNHAPFTGEHNKTGLISGEKLMEAITKSGLEETILMFEIGHREHYDTEFKIIEELAESVEYWRRWVKN